MSEEAITYASPAPPESKPEAKETRVYVAKVWGLPFAVEGTRRENVIAHLVQRLRREIEVSLATFEDGMECADKGILLEQAGQNETADMFGEGGVS